VGQLTRLHERHGVEIVEFCPDLEDTFEREPDALAKSTWVWLWWD
jgi:hypothetical protein